MRQEIIDFLKSQRVCVLAVEMMDGSPHGATVHFAADYEPFTFFFETDRSYRKAGPLLNKKVTRATVVVGFNEKNRKTLQLDGEIHVVTNEEKEFFDRIYFEKFPEKKEKSLDPKFIFLSFAPQWWRYTDWDSPSGKIVISSEDNK